MTQSELAKRIGVQPNYIVYLEKGERKPSDRTVVKIADALDLNRGEIYLAANPQVRQFLNVDDGNTVVRDALPGGLRRLSADEELRARLDITDDEIAAVAGVRFNGRVTTAEQYLTLILVMRDIFA